MMRFFRKLVPVFILLAFTTVLAQPAAQDTTCGVFVQQAMTQVESGCSGTGRNQACYGYVSLQATPREGVTNFQFTRQGDLANVADLSSVQLDPLNTEADTWGIVLMKLQASLPETLPGQNVTFLLFGDVEIRNAVDPEADPTLQPMQAFYLNTGITQTDCAAAPADGILIQTPEGVGKVHMRANGVDIQLGSTAFLRAQPEENLIIDVLEGESAVRSGGKTVIVPDGAEIEIPIDEDFQAEGEPGEPYAYELEFLEDLPIDVLPEEFIIDEPSSEEELEEAFFESEELDLLDDETELEAEALPEDEQLEDAPLEDEAPADDAGAEPLGDLPPDDSGGGEGDGGE
jgi:hypothetical protein